MIDEVKQDIEKRLNLINTLPKKNKEQRSKLSSYLDDNLDKYNSMLDDVKKEMDSRYNKIIKSNDNDIENIDNPFDYVYIKELEPKINSYYKMDLDYYLYKLDHYYKNDLSSSNEIILKIIDKFKMVGIKLTEKDFNYCTYVNTYMKALINKDNIDEVFNNIYWQCSNIIALIVFNFKKIYYKNVKKIDKYFQNKIKTTEDVNKYIMKQSNLLNDVEKSKHFNKKYILNCFSNKDYIINDYTITNIAKIKDNILTNEENISNLLSLKFSLEDYQNYLRFQYIFDDLKKLYSNKSTYKGLVKAKLALISKKEAKVVNFGKKIETNSNAKLEFNKLVDEILNDYKELDDLLIKEDIFKYINDDTTWHEYIKIAVNNFNYISSIIKTTNDDMSLDEIISNIIDLKNYIYNQKQNILGNISVGTDNNIPRIIVNRYKMTDINITEENIMKDNIESFLKNVNILIVNNDIKNVGLSYEDINYVLNIDKMNNKVIKK